MIRAVLSVVAGIYVSKTSKIWPSALQTTTCVKNQHEKQIVWQFHLLPFTLGLIKEFKEKLIFQPKNGEDFMFNDSQGE